MRGTNTDVVLLCQVSSAKAEHCVETATGLLRRANFPGESRVVYLGNVAGAIIRAMESPETPEFIETPRYNEQKWRLKTTSGAMSVTISSEPYWGFGLFTSGYLNTVEISGPINIIARLIFDLDASLATSPWRFKHTRAANKYLAKNYPSISIEGNEKTWQSLIGQCKNDSNEMIHIMTQAVDNIEQKVSMVNDFQGWSKDKALVNIAAARYDLAIAKEALADRNMPSVERALARIEAALIEANPDHAMNDDDGEFNIDKSLERISFDEDLVIKSVDDESIPLIDLTESE
ncbi:MAG: hypothetical protein ISP82_07710 [Candidatus Poseidoniaceae archaeon]|nr:hypothetical protein [Candidatus Poseidoniaceae archaeon]